MEIRRFRPSDRQILKDITVEAFNGVSIDQNIEKMHGIIGGTDWKWRKARHIEADIEANAPGIFVAEEDGRVVGYITARLDEATGIGWIPNMAVTVGGRGKGVGKALLAAALKYLKESGMKYAKIETLEQNKIGSAFFPRVGFKEVARQIHYFMELK
jgi:ribosomal protein S18 acetylase RimI-like enzyme